MSIAKVNGANRKRTRNRGCSRRGLFESGTTRSPPSRIHRNRLGSNGFARIGVFPRWTNRRSLAGGAPDLAHCTGNIWSWPANNPPFHTHTARPLTRNKKPQEGELLLSISHSFERVSQKKLQNSPTNLDYQQYVLQLSNKRNQEERP